MGQQPNLLSDIYRGNGNLAQIGDALWTICVGRWANMMGIPYTDSFWYQQLTQSYVSEHWMHRLSQIIGLDTFVTADRASRNEQESKRSRTESFEALLGALSICGVPTDQIILYGLQAMAGLPSQALVPLRGDWNDSQVIFPGSKKIGPKQVEGKMQSILVDIFGQTIFVAEGKKHTQAEAGLNNQIQARAQELMAMLESI